MRQRITRRLRAAKHRLQQLPELYEAYILMRFPFHQLKEDVAAYERAVNMYTNHVDEIIDNLKYVAGIELMNAAQGIEFRRPLKSSPYIESVLKAYREVVPFVEDDVVMADYIADTMRFLEKFEVELPVDPEA